MRRRPPAGAAGAARNPPPPPMTVSQPAPLKDVAGKVAYITASSDGIGLGIARACSNAGMKVVIGYRNELRLAEALPLFPKGNPVFSVKHDVTDRDGWKRALDQINQKFGNLHLLVNNAGAKDLAALSRGTFQDWDNSVAVDFTGAFNGISTVIPHFKAHGEGAHIVNTCSVSGIIPAGSAGMYLAVKMGSMGLIEGPARRTARHQYRYVGLLSGRRRHRQPPRRSQAGKADPRRAAAPLQPGDDGSPGSGRARR